MTRKKKPTKEEIFKAEQIKVSNTIHIFKEQIEETSLQEALEDYNPFPSKIRLGNQRGWDLLQFSEGLKIIGEIAGFKISARGWAYQMEGFGIIDKSEFDKISSIINQCRKQGYLPLDFVAYEKAREFEHIFKPEKLSVKDKLLKYLEDIHKQDTFYFPDYWKDEDYYIQVLVEKIDLVTLFEPVCKRYRVPIATSKGWSSIMQRAELIERFKFHEDAGRTPVLLYCGDFDPAGLEISNQLKKNFADLYQATKWDPYNKLIVKRFGLNYDFIEENNLTWIDNLVTGSGKEADGSLPKIAKYIAQYGRRKCEANALVARPEAGRDLIEDAISEFIDEERIIKKDNIVTRRYDHLNSLISDYLDDATYILKDDNI